MSTFQTMRGGLASRLRKLAFLACALSGMAANALQPIALVPPGGPAAMPRSYFGMHIHRAQLAGHWPQVTFGSWRLWDADVSWPNLEPERGQWNFNLLDTYVDKAQSAGVELLLPLGRTPRWASARPGEFSPYGPGQAAEPINMEDWRNYVRRLVTRYQGRIAAYEIWNEVTEKVFWTGTTDKLVELTRIATEEIRKVDPEAKLIGPSGVGLDARTAWTRKFLDAGGAQWVNASSYHLYHGVHAPELKIPSLLQMRADLRAGGYGDKPIWNTESGYNTESIDPGVQWSPDELKYRTDVATVASYVVRDLLIARAIGFERFYWYAWDNSKMGLIDEKSLRVRQSGVVFGNAAAYLTRSVLERCDMDATGVWSCRLTLANGRAARVLWQDPQAASALTFPSPFAGSLKSFENAEERPVLQGAPISLALQPVLLTQAAP
jgi:hypothetical protein